MVYNPEVDEYEPVVFDLNGFSETLTGEWYPTQTIIPEHTLTVQMPASEAALVNESITVLLSMGIEFGNVGFDGKPVEVKWAGCGKVLAAL